MFCSNLVKSDFKIIKQKKKDKHVGTSCMYIYLIEILNREAISIDAYIRSSTQPICMVIFLNESI